MDRHLWISMHRSRKGMQMRKEDEFVDIWRHTSLCILHIVPWDHQGCRASHTYNTFKIKTSQSIQVLVNTTKHNFQLLLRKGWSSIELSSKAIRNSHSNTVRSKPPCGSFVLEPAKIILRGHILQFGVVLKRVHYALPFDGVCTLHIKVIWQEQLFGPMELSATTNRLLRSVIPSNSDLHIIPVISL